jgi:hypothetical protein
MFRSKAPLTIKKDSSGRLKALSHIGSRPTSTQGGYKSTRNVEQASNHSVTTQYFTGQQMTTLFTGLYPDAEESLNRYYKDIYSFDAAAGSAVDLISSLPFSDWSLSGADAQILDKFQSSIERLNLRVMLPEIAVDYLVHGAFIGTLVFKESDGIFTDIIPHPKEHCKIKSMPFYGLDPVIEVSVDDTVRNFLESSEPRIAGYRSKINPKLLKLLQSKKFTLDPVTTLFLPRKTYANSVGTSYYRRIMPLYYLEKVMYKGTLVEAAKRQRAMMHIQAGDDLWEPTPEDLQFIASLFQQSDLDPAGAIVVTRQSVNPSEIRQGGDFWKWTDLLDQTTPLKLRALGISDTFLSGETTYATAEVSLSVFIENLLAFRNLVTLKTFYNRLFPIISIINDYKKDPSKKQANPYRSSEEKAESLDENDVSRLSKEDILYKMADTSKLIIPKVNWHKNLQPRNDSTYMEVLNQLKEQGIPIPIRMWAAAGGITIESIINDLEDNQMLEEKLSKYKDAGNRAEEGGEDDESAFEEASTDLANQLRKTKRKKWLHRDYAEMNEVVGRTKTGKKKYIHNQGKAQRDANEHIAKALKNLSDPDHYNKVTEGVKKRLGKIPKIS